MRYDTIRCDPNDNRGLFGLDQFAKDITLVSIVITAVDSATTDNNENSVTNCTTNLARMLVTCADKIVLLEFVTDGNLETKTTRDLIRQTVKRKPKRLKILFGSSNTRCAYIYSYAPGIFSSDLDRRDDDLFIYSSPKFSTHRFIHVSTNPLASFTPTVDDKAPSTVNCR